MYISHYNDWKRINASLALALKFYLNETKIAKQKFHGSSILMPEQNMFQVFESFSKQTYLLISSAR